MSEQERRRHGGQLSLLRDLRAEFDAPTFDRLADAFGLDAFQSLNRLEQASDEEGRAASVHRLAGILAQYGFGRAARHVEDYRLLGPGTPEAAKSIVRMRYEIYVATRTLRRIGARSTAQPLSPKLGV